jgi:hypothetical protein
VVLAVVALLPVAILPLWERPRARPVLLGLCWVLAVGFGMHGLVDDAQRVLSLTGTLQLHYPCFTTVDRHRVRRRRRADRGRAAERVRRDRQADRPLSRLGRRRMRRRGRDRLSRDGR